MTHRHAQRQSVVDRKIPLWIFPKYSRNGASSRLRLYQYIPELESAGFDLHISCLFDDTYLENLYFGNRPSYWLIVRGYLNRICTLCNVRQRDLVLIEGELFPWLPAFFERFFLRRRKYILDYDDAIFHRYDMSSLYLIRVLLGRKIDQLMKKATLVMAGNAYLEKRAKDAGARHIEKLPTVVDINRYSMARFHSEHVPPTIGWIGTPITWGSYGEPLFEMLMEKLAGEDIQFVAIGASTSERQLGALRLLPWAEATEAESIAELTVGVMPLDDTEWARGKCGYKLIQYLASGVPVVASPVGANCEIVRDGENGYLAENAQEWVASVSALLTNPDHCRQLGKRGRDIVRRDYSVQSTGPRLVKYLVNIANCSAE